MKGSSADELARRHRDALVRYARAHLGPGSEAEDAAQEVLARAVSAGDALADERAWLYRVLRNHCHNLLRARGRMEQPESTFEPVEEATRVLSRLVREEQHVELSHWIARLPEREREALILRYVDGLSREEIATVLDTTPATVKTWLFAGLKRLRSLAGVEL